MVAAQRGPILLPSATPPPRATSFSPPTHISAGTSRAGKAFGFASSGAAVFLGAPILGGALRDLPSRGVGSLLIFSQAPAGVWAFANVLGTGVVASFGGFSSGGLDAERLTAALFGTLVGGDGHFDLLGGGHHLLGSRSSGAEGCQLQDQQLGS